MDAYLIANIKQIIIAEEEMDAYLAHKLNIQLLFSF